MLKAILVLVIYLSALESHAQYSLKDFFTYNPKIEHHISALINEMNNRELAGQMLVVAAGEYGISEAKITNLIKANELGGILLLKGEKLAFTAYVSEKNRLIAQVNGIPLSYSADAEPSLLKYKIKKCNPVKNAIDHKSILEVQNTASSISKDIQSIGITQNYAPVIDVGTNNEAIGNRSFGNQIDTITKWSESFIKVTQDYNIIATAKHFPGHGQVKGDSHKKLVYIDGELKEARNYQTLIDKGIISIMVGHIAIKNNDEYSSDLPSTLNPKIVTELLKEKMNFKGLVITDAMGMQGVVNVPNHYVLAVKAGVDILLMPKDAQKAITAITTEMESNPQFKKRVEDAVRKILRAKICQNLIKID